MSVKGTKSTKTVKPKVARSNVAKAKGKAGLLSKKLKFNWKIVAVIGVVLVAALGYLLVRLSRAGEYTWPPSMIKVEYGRQTTKNGKPAIESIPGTDGSNKISVFVYSSVPAYDSYCFEGWTGAEIKSWVINAYFEGSNTPIAASAGSQIGPIVSGNFTRCLGVDGNLTGIPRKINFIARSTDGQPIYIYSIYRIGKTGPPIKR